MQSRSRIVGMTFKGGRYRKKDALRQRLGDALEQSQSCDRGSRTAPKAGCHRYVALSFDEDRGCLEPGPTRNGLVCALHRVLARDRRRTLHNSERRRPVVAYVDDAHAKVQLDSHGKGVEAAAEVRDGRRHDKVVDRRTAGPVK